MYEQEDALILRVEKTCEKRKIKLDVTLQTNR